MLPLKQHKAIQQRVRRESMMFTPPEPSPLTKALEEELERCKDALYENARIPADILRHEEVVQPGVVRRKVS